MYASLKFDFIMDVLNLILLLSYLPFDSSFIPTQSLVINLGGWFIVSSNRFLYLYCFLIFHYYIIIFIIVRVICMSGHFCNTRLFSNFSFSALRCKNFEVMKLAATRYDETNVDIHPFLILNMEKPKILNGIFFSVIKKIVCTNYSYKLLLHE